MKKNLSLVAVILLSLAFYGSASAQNSYVESRFTIDEKVRQAGGYANVTMLTVGPNGTYSHKVNFSNDFDFVDGNGCIARVLVDLYVNGQDPVGFSFDYDPAVCGNRLFAITLGDVRDETLN